MDISDQPFYGRDTKVGFISIKIGLGKFGFLTGISETRENMGYCCIRIPESLLPPTTVSL